MRRAAARALRDAASRGVREGVAVAAPAADHDRPPAAPAAALARAASLRRPDRRHHINRPTLSPGGCRQARAHHRRRRLAVFDAHRTRSSEAECKGEIHVRSARLGGGAPEPVSAPVQADSRRPYLADNSVVAAGGSAVAYETAQSTLPLAKRVGQMSLLVRDLRTGAIDRVSHSGLPAGAPTRRSPPTAGASSSRRPTRRLGAAKSRATACGSSTARA
jgi:hypothetical protein